jgi:hypothetical protein
MARGGKLVFKGDDKAKKKKKTKSSVGSAKAPEASAHAHHSIGSSVQNNIDKYEPVAAAPAAAESQLPPPSITNGNGLISTSGTVVSGHNTSFKSDLRIGDAIIANTQKGEEMRIVTMVLSQVSISISSAFSSDLKTPTQYKFIVKPRDLKRERADKARKAMAEKEEVEARAMGTYGTNTGEIIYREKTEHGSYRIRREQTDVEMSRSDLLSVRAKKKSDRYC